MEKDSRLHKHTHKQHTKLDDVERVGTGDAVELHLVFADASVLGGVNIFIAQLDELTALSAPGDIVFLEISDECRLLHSETASHYTQSNVLYLTPKWGRS